MRQSVATIEKKTLIFTQAMRDAFQEPAKKYLELINKESIIIPDGGGTINRSVDELAADILITHSAQLEKVPQRLKKGLSVIRKIRLDVPPDGFSEADRDVLLELPALIDTGLQYAKKGMGKDAKLGKVFERLQNAKETFSKSGMQKQAEATFAAPKKKAK